MKISVDLHTHTNVSAHAYSTLMENIDGARQNGIRAIAVTNHGPALGDAPHIWHFFCLNELPDVIDGIRVLKGAECNIMNSGGELDISDGVLKTLDVVIASQHGPVYIPQTSEECTEMYLKVLDNPLVDIIGHPDRIGTSFDMESVVKKAGSVGKLIEINDHSLDFTTDGVCERTKELARLCNLHGTHIAVNTDAHFCLNVGRIRNAYEMLEDLGFDKELILNLDYDKTINYFTERKR